MPRTSQESTTSAERGCDPKFRFRFAVDRGGTFTDLYCQYGPEGKVTTQKLLSVDPAYPDAPREGIRRVLEEITGIKHPRDEPLDTSRIDSIRMGTTVATNALLERKGDPCVLVITSGFKDLLHIGNQSRPNIFDLSISCPGLIFSEVVEATERVALVQEGSRSSGGEIVEGVTGEMVEVVKPLEEDSLKAKLSELHTRGFRSAAVLLMHSYTFRRHEEIVGKICMDVGFQQVSLSSSILPMVRAVPRGFTACADAYLSPSIARYLQTFQSGFDAGLENVELQFMQSDGGLASVSGFNGFQAILSGPAGGVVGYAKTLYDSAGGSPLIGFDMGGTSTDVSRYAGSLEQVIETTTAGVTIQAPQLDITTVASGGGSCLAYDAGLFRVGPDSAGAHPGPTCYRKGGPLSITDANLQLGRIVASRFPHIFGHGENEPLDVEATRSKFEQLTKGINQSQLGAAPMTADSVAFGFVKVANEAMCRPIREITSARGHDVRKHVLACFGGAGGQHACAMARSLGISKIFVHRYASILSAVGLFMADVVSDLQEPCACKLEHSEFGTLAGKLTGLFDRTVAKLSRQGFQSESIFAQCFVNLRYEGTDCAVMTGVWEDDKVSTNGPPTAKDMDEVVSRFLLRYKHEFGFLLDGRHIVVDDVRVKAVGRRTIQHGLPMADASQTSDSVDAVVGSELVYFEGGRQKTCIMLLERMKIGSYVRGPAILLDKMSTILVEPGCSAQVSSQGHVEITIELAVQEAVGTAMDPVQLSIFSHRFMSIAEQMGRTLQRTSISTNIKERLDFSCALFDQHGGLVANAPHIPVHLGSMQDAVRHQVRYWGNLLVEGDVLMTNHPVAGGTHLPDITIITPVFKQGSPVLFVASRGHHADIGGISPGSMPPHSKSLADEGLAVEAFKLIEGGVFMDKEVRDLLQSPSQHPGCSGARKSEDNMSDLRAQVAANQKGISLINELVQEYSLPVVQAYMLHIQRNAETAVRELLCKVAKDITMQEAGKKRKRGGHSGAEFEHDNRKDYYDDDESCPVKSVTKDGVVHLRAQDFMDDGTPICLHVSIDGTKGEAVMDFEGTGIQVMGNCNAPRSVTYSAIIYALRSMVKKEIPLNQGCLNPVVAKIPQGSILWPSDTAAVVGGNVLTSQRLVDVILKAFDAAAASQGCMNNFTMGDSTFGYYETIGGGAGAGPTWNGRSGVHTHMTNTRITDVEIMERRYPVMVLKFGLRQNSGGIGLYCGGHGLEREILFRRTLNVSLLTERRAMRPFGLHGGGPGKAGQNHLVREDGTRINLGGKNELTCFPGDILQIHTPGGGAYGMPA